MGPNVNSSIRLVTAFAVPMGVTNFEDSSGLNQELAQLFLAREAHGNAYSNKQRNSISQNEVFESSFDLFQWQDRCIQQLRDMCFQRLVTFIAQLSRLTPEAIKHWEVHADAWFHVTRHGGYFSAHNHPNASWSAVYCVSHGDDVPERPESAVTRFFDFKSNAMMYLDVANTQLSEPFGLGHRVFNLRAGDFLIFPSYLLHEVSPYFGQKERITVAMNCWFKDRRKNFPG